MKINITDKPPAPPEHINPKIELFTFYKIIEGHRSGQVFLATPNATCVYISARSTGLNWDYSKDVQNLYKFIPFEGKIEIECP